jgi:hypothetical protein
MQWPERSSCRPNALPHGSLVCAVRSSGIPQIQLSHDRGVKTARFEIRSWCETCFLFKCYFKFHLSQLDKFPLFTGEISRKSEIAFFDRIFWGTRTRQLHRISDNDDGKNIQYSIVFEPASHGIFLQMTRETYKFSWNMHCERQIIALKVFIDAFASSLLDSRVLALIAWSETENFCRGKNQPKRSCCWLPKMRSAMILVSKTGRNEVRELKPWPGLIDSTAHSHKYAPGHQWRYY